MGCQFGRRIKVYRLRCRTIHWYIGCYVIFHQTSYSYKPPAFQFSCNSDCIYSPLHILKLPFTIFPLLSGGTIPG